MKRYIIYTLALLASVGFAYAQDDVEEASRVSPAPGKFTASILFGRGNFLQSGLDNTDPAGIIPIWTVPGTAPTVNMISANSNDAANMIGAEFRYFLSGNHALKVSGGGIIRSTPYRVNVPAIIDPNAPNATWIPAYEAVEEQVSVDVNVNLGWEYHFSTPVSRLRPFLGINVPFYYGSRAAYDPSIIEDGGGNPIAIDVGQRTVQLYGFGGAAVAGVDYYLAEGFYLGIEIKPVNYIYSFSQKVPGPGLEELPAETHTLSFMTQPFIKLGFRF